MRFFVLAVLFALFLPQGLADNIINGKITILDDGTLIFEGHLERDDLNVTYAFLNTERDTPVETEQTVYAVFNGTSLGHPPANAAVMPNSTSNATADRYSKNISLADYLVLHQKGMPANNTQSDKAFLEKRGSDWYFALHLDEWMDVYDLQIEFPAGTEFKEISTDMDYDRFDSSLHFKGTLVEAPRIDVVYSINPKAPAKNDDNGYSFYAVATLLVLVFAIALFKKVKKKQLNREVIKTLNEKQKLLITTLFENNGKLTQTRLRQRTGLPKSTLSNIIRDLENRQLVKRFEHGSTWDIELNKRLYK